MKVQAQAALAASEITTEAAKTGNGKEDLQQMIAVLLCPRTWFTLVSMIYFLFDDRATWSGVMWFRRLIQRCCVIS